MFPALQRVFEITGCSTQALLADLLAIKQSSVSDVKRRGTIPPDWLVKLLRLRGINPNWILTGEGSKYLAPSESGPVKPHVAYLVETRPPKECSAQDLINELVKRALKSPDLEEIRKQIGDSWFPVNKPDGNS